MRLNFWLGILVSAAAVAAILFQIDFRDAADAFRTAHYGWVLPAAITSLVLIFIRAWRWRYLLRDDLQASFHGRLSATFIGFMANGLLPARIGEFVRAWCLGHREGKSKSAIFASIIIERLLDGSWILIFLVIALWVVPFPDPSPGGGGPEGFFLGGFSLRSGLRWAGILSLAFYAGIILLLVGLRLSHGKTLWVLDRLLSPVSHRFAGKARDTLDGFIGGIYVPDSWSRGTMTIFYTCLLWVIGLGTNYFTLRAFGLDLPWHAPVFLMVLQALGVMIPSSPGFVGTFHAAAVLGARFYGVPDGVALSFAVVVHIAGFLPIIVVGLGFLWRENLSLGQLVSTRQESAT
ncbi:MAG: lysylphosphatidylglycerol synthase transmembrane domain-containing protein [Nitrospinota bacterium]